MPKKHQIGEEEFHLLAHSKNRAIPSETNYIWILTSRHNIYKEHVNCTDHPQNYEEIPGQTSEQSNKDLAVVCDIEDGFQRVKAAVNIAVKLTARRAKKTIDGLVEGDYAKHGPVIIYNGWPLENVQFRKAIAEGLPKIDLPYYPADKFSVFDMPKDEPHTGGQFISLVEEIKRDPKLAALNILPNDPKEKSHVTMVTSAYHVPRVRRLLASKLYPFPFHQQTHINIHAIDRKFQRPCAQRDRLGELGRLVKYIKEGKIDEKPYKCDWFDPHSMKSWTPFRQCSVQSKESDHMMLVHSGDVAVISTNRKR